jgi:PDZ domain
MTGYRTKPDKAHSAALPVLGSFRPLRAFLMAVLVMLAAAFAAPDAAFAQKNGLPKPYVSPSLDAVLMPITAAVRKEFKLGKKAAGAVVVSVDPGGVGELYGLTPGEVITKVNDRVIRRPVDVDTIVKHGLNTDRTFFFLEGTRKNKKKKTILEITNDDYKKPVDIANIARWPAYNSAGSKAKGKRGKGGRGDDGYFITGGGGFYYADFCDSYYTDFYEVYEYTLIYVEEIVITDVFITAYESDTTVFYYDDASVGYAWPDDSYYIEEVDSYVYSEEFVSSYESTEIYYDDEIDPDYAAAVAESGFDDEGYLATDEGAAADDGYVDDGTAADDGYVDDGTVADDGYVDDGTVADDGYVDDGTVADDGYVDDAFVDDGSGSFEEPAYEEPAYEEPAYEEPAYEEPAYEEPAYEEPAYEEPAYEEPAYEEPAYEEPAYEEPAYEEPAYEEPAYEEPAYEEPAYDGGGGGCYYDDEGNEICG